MAQVGVVKLTPFTYPNGKNDTQLWQHIAGLLAIASPGTTAAGTAGPVTAYSITSNVITLTAVNSLTTGGGQEVRLSGFATSTFLNGADLIVSSATGTTIVASFVHANASATEAGFFALSPQYATNGIPINWVPMQDASGRFYLTETNQSVPTTGSPTFISQIGSGVVYNYDPVHNTIRVVVGGTELVATTAVPLDTITFNADFLKA